MDPRQQNQGYSGSNAQRAGNNYGYNGIQNDQFSSFVNEDSAFDSSWNNPVAPPQQQHINGFEQDNHAWRPNAYSAPNYLGTSSYELPSKEYDQTYSRSPSAFHYPAIDPSQGQTFTSNSYDNTNAYENHLYGHGPLNSNAQFEYPTPTELQQRQQQHNTISPQALQTYPSFLPQSVTDGSQQSHHAPYNSNMPVRRPSATESSLHPGPNWLSLANATSASISPNGLHIKPTAGLQNATKSRREDGFVFVGISSPGPAGIKIKIARSDKKRSLKAIRRTFESEKGSDAWAKDRGHLMKKLKVTESKLGSRPTKISSNARSASISESISSSESSDSESDDESASYTDSEVEVAEPEELNPLPTTRPADPNKAVEYDVIKAVWAKRKAGLSGTVIRFALGEYWDIFKGIRDKWKLKATSLQQAIDKKDHANVKAYERRVYDQRRLLESCIGLTLKHGHTDIIEKLGENPAFLVIFYQFLADRFKDSEYAGSLIASILELMTRCTTIDQAILEKTKLDKVLPRIVKRGDDRGRVLAQNVLDKAAHVSKQKTVAKSTESQQSNESGLKNLSDHRAVKREQTDEVKKIASTTSKGPTSTAPAKSANASVKPDVKALAKPTTADPATVKLKSNSTVTKPTGFFAGLKSASKKPGTSAKLEDGKSNSEVKAEVSPAAPKSGFSFAATMAALSAQKEATPVKTEEIRKPETVEEKKKRLRKEERRKLRVSFKADDDLVQIREFVHDPEEELGHEDSQVRDVKDTRGEGQMLKMHRDLDVDDEEDYEPPEEIVLPEWTTPQSIDFSVVDEQELARNYASRGGRAELDSPERTVQEQREQATLMAIYTNDFDIPPSAREPSDTHTGDTLMEETFGSPDEQIKARENEYYMRRNMQPVAATPPVPDISALLRIIQTQNQPQAQQAPQPMPTPAPSAGLESIFAQFATPNPQPAPQIQQQPAHAQAPSYGFQAALASMQTPQHQPVYGAAPSGQAPDLQALLAGLTNPAASQVPQMQGYGYGAMYQNENDRKRQYDQDENDFGRKRAKGLGASSKDPSYKTKPCRYYKEGKCRRGDDCSYLHE